MKRTLGVCYYPEHWPEEWWPHDAAKMVETGLSWVRIGEFAWSRMEPEPGKFDWGWLDRAIEVLGGAGLKVILGTPTATPPRWMLDKHPDMLAHDAQGHPRKFGSRRHYCFSHDRYREESRRITRLLAERYGKNPHIAAWQTDNEYDCHDTVLSYSPHAVHAFRDWLAQRYQSVDALNRAWGNVFWSMVYDDFDQIDLPNLTVTEPNPAHVLAFRRFSSDQVARFNAAQVAEIRKHSSAPIIHNYMGRITSFDHYKVGEDLDIASWDSYPMGFLLDRNEGDEAWKARFLRQGDPDFQAFHHDLYRAVGKGRWWVMEQQPGPVNWAPWNPAPLPGMVRLWAWEAFAHGAETVCLFRWRQAPFAQEQQHAGLLRPDSEPAPGLAETARVARELAEVPQPSAGKAPVALIFDYDSAFAWEAQPQGADFDYFWLCFEAYRALRRAGLTIDILPPSASVSDYQLVLAPGLMVIPDHLKAGHVVLGPRAGAKTPEMSIPVPLPPGLSEITVAHVETLPPFAPVAADGGGAITRWRDHVEGKADVLIADTEGRPILARAEAFYLAGWPDAALWRRVIETAAPKLAMRNLPEGVRCRETDTHRFWFNYNQHAFTYQGRILDPAGVVWEEL